jgi:predicted TPR repeat methyltransferase
MSAQGAASLLRFQEAQQLHNAGNVSKAFDCYQQILQTESDFIDCLHLAGVAAHQLNQHEMAIELIQRAISLNGRVPSFHSNLGLALQAIGRLEEAGLAFENALGMAPGYALGHLNIGGWHANQGNIEAAVSHFQSALLLDPNLAVAHLNLGNSFFRINRLDEASDCYFKAIAIDPDYADAFFGLGLVHSKIGRTQDAIDYLDRALILNPKNPGVCFAIANSLLAAGQAETAIDRFRQGLEVSPENIEARILLGTTLWELGRLTDATAEARLALRLALSPSTGLGVLLARCGLLEEARAQLKACVDSDQGDLDGAQTALACLGLVPTPDKPSDSAVKKFYAHTADLWDQKMNLSERYFGPALAVAALTRLVDPSESLDILDAGCGTGLVGQLLKERAKTLDGVDLSPDMLRVAQKKRIFNQLYQADIAEFLNHCGSEYDVITCVAALIFNRNLSPAFTGAMKALRNDGIFILTLNPTEGGATEETSLSINGTYTHSAEYISRTALASGFSIEFLEEIIHELKDTKPVKGFLVALRKNTNLS